MRTNDDEARATAEGGVPSVTGTPFVEQPVPAPTEQPALSRDEFEAAHGERLSEALDLGTWTPGADLAAMYARLEREVAEAVRKETEYQRLIRANVFPRLRSRDVAPPRADVYGGTLALLD